MLVAMCFRLRSKSCAGQAAPHPPPDETVLGGKAGGMDARWLLFCAMIAAVMGCDSGSDDTDGVYVPDQAAIKAAVRRVM